MILRIILYVLQAIASVIIPLAVVGYLKNKFTVKLKNLFDGVAVFFIFYCLVYAVISTCAELFTPLYEKVESEIWLIIINALVESLCVFIGYAFWYKVAIKIKDKTDVGLMTGTGFAFIRTIFAYGINAVLCVVTGLMYIKGKLSFENEIIQSSLDGFLISTPDYISLLLLQLIAVFALEVAVALIIYRVKMCEDAKYWILAAFVLRTGAITVLKCGNFLNRTAIVFMVIAIAVVLSGIACSLVKPFVRKTDKT